MTKLCFFSTSKWKEFQFGLDATPLYTPRQHPVFPLLYWTNISFSVIDRPYLFDDWCCEFLSHHQVVHERHFWMFLFGDRFFFRPQRVGLYKNFQTWRSIHTHMSLLTIHQRHLFDFPRYRCLSFSRPSLYVTSMEFIWNSILPKNEYRTNGLSHTIEKVANSNRWNFQSKQDWIFHYNYWREINTLAINIVCCEIWYFLIY